MKKYFKPNFLKSLLFSLFFLSHSLTFSQVYNPLVYFLNGTPTYGVKIKTNLPFRDGSQMPTIIIEGYNYGNKSTIGLTLVYYIYGGNFYYPKISSHGGYTPTVKLANEGGKVVIFIDEKYYCNRFNIRVIAKGMSETAEWFTGWTAVDEPLQGTSQVTVPYENKFSGNILFSNGIWNENGRLGIGTYNPVSKLDINGGVNISGINLLRSVNGFHNMLQLTNPLHAAIVYNAGKKDELMFGFHSNGNFYWGTGHSANKPDYYSMILNASSGNLGIKGKLTANEVNIKTGGWSDFVFEPDYNLMSLNDLYVYITKHKHLPDVPTEEEVLTTGLNLAETNALLLQKIEELTLYIIDQDKKIDLLIEKTEKLIDANKYLRHKINKLESIHNKPQNTKE